MPAYRGDRRSRSPARSTANPPAPGGVEVTDATVDRADRAGRDPAGRAVAADARPPGCPTLLDHAAVALRHPARQARVAARRGQPARLPGHARRATDFTEVHTPEARRVGDRERRQRVRGRLLRPAGATSPSRRSSTSRCWSGSSSGSTRSGRCSGPSRTTRCATSRSTSRSTSSSASSRDHRDVIAVLRDVVAGMVAGGRTSTPPSAVALLGVDVPEVPEELPVAALPRGARDRRRARRRARPRPGARAGARRVGAGASTAATSSSSRATRRPSRRVLQPPRPRGPALVPLVRPDLPRASSWSAARSGCTGYERLRRGARARGASPTSRTRRTSRRSGTACRRTAASRSGSSAGWRGSSGRRTSARSRCSPATCTGWRRSGTHWSSAGRVTGRDWGMRSPMTLIRLVARPMLASMFVMGGYQRPAEPPAARPDGRAGHREALRRRCPRRADPGQPRREAAGPDQRRRPGRRRARARHRPRSRGWRPSCSPAPWLPTTYAGHRFWEEKDKTQRANQQIHFFKNVSMFGGLLIAAVDTEGKPGVAWRAKHARRHRQARGQAPPARGQGAGEAGRQERRRS